MAGPLKNERHERMAQELAKGLPQFEAYRNAGFRGPKSTASEIAAREDVRARVAEILERAAVKAEITVADIARQLDEDRDLAHKVEQPGAAVSASMGKAKLLGLIVDKVQQSGTVNVHITGPDANL